MNRAADQVRRQAASLELELTRSELDETTSVLARIPGASAAYAPWLDAAARRLAQGQRGPSGGDAGLGQRQTRQAAALVAAVRRAAWRQAVMPLGSPLSDPLAATFPTLPDHIALAARLRGARRGGNLLVAGECERLEEMLAAGWKHYRHTQDEARGDVELSPIGPYAGGASLRLVARPANEAHPATLLETPPLWVVSPAAPVRPGTLVRIAGRVRVPRPIRASVDGLMILDSAGGEPLALRIGQAAEWQPFEMLRVAGSEGAIQLTFALTGFGEAHLDDITIEPVPVE
jgi:hypothetical protein